MGVVFVHGFPETAALWRPLHNELGVESDALHLPGLDGPRPQAFSGSKDALADWLANRIAAYPEPVDLVAHDVGALLALRVVTAYDLPIRSWIVDVAALFHPDFVWSARVVDLQTPGVGERIMAAEEGQAGRLAAAGVPRDLAEEMGVAHGVEMSRSILDFYRSALPNLAHDWWPAAGPATGAGLVLLLPDPPDVEAMTIDVARHLGAETARLDGLGHCWMAQDPVRVAAVLRAHWGSD